MMTPSRTSLRQFVAPGTTGVISASYTFPENGAAGINRYIDGAGTGMSCFGTDAVSQEDIFIASIVLAVFDGQAADPEAPYTAKITFARYPAVRLVVDPPAVEHEEAASTVVSSLKLYIEDELLFQNSPSTTQEIYQAVQESLRIFRKHYSL